jgi:hypothetical protein
MAWPQKEAVIPALGTHARTRPGKIANVELLGFGGKLQWRQEASGLHVEMPPQKPSEYAIALKISGAVS